MNLYAVRYADDPICFYKATSAEAAYKAHKAGYDPGASARLLPEKFVIDRIDTVAELMPLVPDFFVTTCAAQL